LAEVGLNVRGAGAGRIVKSYGTGTGEPANGFAQAESLQRLRDSVPVMCPGESEVAGTTVIEYEPLLFAVTDFAAESTFPGSANDTFTDPAKGVAGVTVIVNGLGDPWVNVTDRVLGVSV
jgi:hypothetical protein